ncbi:MAG: hypothetical protein RBU30_15810, partial [Polyangia bacterium]|nr:hypothetical protein [Polyangia bacterium]
TSAWRGIARYAPSSFLVYGTGSGHNLVQCTDTENDGLATCAALSGLPNQADTSFIDGTAGYSGGAVLLAARCAMDPCFTSAFSLYVLPAGANPAVPGVWVVLPLGTASSLAGPTQVVSAPYAFHAVGKDGSDAPALWSWAP